MLNVSIPSYDKNRKLTSGNRRSAIPRPMLLKFAQVNSCTNGQKFMIGSTAALSNSILFHQLTWSFSASVMGRDMSMVSSSPRADQIKEPGISSQNRREVR
jgi:hypothetical protein